MTRKYGERLSPEDIAPDHDSKISGHWKDTVCGAVRGIAEAIRKL